jgi:hypothetical protein
MSNIIITFPASEKRAERLLTPPSPTERPTVPNADVTSNKRVKKGRPSIKVETKVKKIMIPNPRKKMTAERITKS